MSMLGGRGATDIEIRKISITPEQAVFGHLTHNGDGSTTDWSVNGSVTPQLFWYEAPAGGIWLDTFKIDIQDTGAFVSEGFASIASALTNGLDLAFTENDGTVITDILDGDAIKSNILLFALMSDAQYVTFGSGDSGISGQIDFSSKEFRYPIFLAEGRRIRLTVNDDLTSVNRAECHIRGRLLG